jgi:cell division protein FtsZ
MSAPLRTSSISSPLLEASIDGARGVLLSISGGSDLGLFEINEAAQLVSEAAHPEANIIFGAVIDDALGDEVRVTVIAAGFDGGQPPSKRDTVLGSASGSAKRDESAPPAAAPARAAESSRPAFGGLGSVTPRDEPSIPEPAETAPSGGETPSAPVAPPQVPPARPYQDSQAEELDVPDFLK